MTHTLFTCTVFFVADVNRIGRFASETTAGAKAPPGSIDAWDLIKQKYYTVYRAALCGINRCSHVSGLVLENR